MYPFPTPLFPRKLSFTTLLDLSEKLEIPQSLEPELLPVPRIAIVGAGITGVSSACFIRDSGLDCHIFEAGGLDSIGGIWTKVNKTSRLQIDSAFYRFHPAVQWTSDYPYRGEILGQVDRLWEMYELGRRTTFNCKVTSVYREGGKWVINDPSNGYFDGIIAAVGTCGDVYAPRISGQSKYRGRLIHSSQLDAKQIKDKNVLIIGGGASAVEAMEFACDNGAASTKVLARSEKWIIPRHTTFDTCLASTIGDRFGILARVIENYLRVFFYKEFRDMAPPANSTDGIFDGTPIVNSRVFELLREGRVSWIRGDVQHFTPNGVRFSRRAPSAPKGELGQLTNESGDLTVLATGFRRPSLDFLPKNKAGSKYQPPNWYLQCFPTEDATICATNCTWREGIGSVGGGHIGIYTRFLMVFLLDPSTQPSPWLMKAWVDLVTLLKKPSPGGPMAFVTAMEMFFWFFVLIALQPALWQWARFIVMGVDPIHKEPSVPIVAAADDVVREPEQMTVESTPIAAVS